MKLRTLLPAGLLMAASVLTPILGNAAEPVLRFAILGDAEPKPKAEFPGVAAAVGHVNHLTDILDLDFVIGVIGKIVAENDAVGQQLHRCSQRVDVDAVAGGLLAVHLKPHLGKEI